MGQEQPAEKVIDDQSQPEAIEPETSDVDFNHVRGLMYTLVTICVFCASILLGPDGQILPADGDLKIPIVNLEIKQGSFLYFGPIIIICVAIYTYLFLLNILASVKAGQISSDKYIFTMKNPAAQVATYCIFFWLPALVLFGFAYKALPRPESQNLIGLFLIFLIFIISIQLLIRVIRPYFQSTVAVSLFCVALVLWGFTGDGWLYDVRLKLHTVRLLSLENANFENRDLRNVDIRNAKGASMGLKGADLGGAVIKDATLVSANLEGANLENAKLKCADLTGANLKGAILNNAELFSIEFSEAEFHRAKLRKANFYDADYESRKSSCKSDENKSIRTSFMNANLDEADLSGANLSWVKFEKTVLRGANLSDTKFINAKIRDSTFEGKTSRVTRPTKETSLTTKQTTANITTKYTKQTDFRRADLRCARFKNANMNGANLENANLGGTNLTGAILTNVNLKGANIDIVVCSDICIKAYIDGDKEKEKTCNVKIKANKIHSRSAKLERAKLQFSDLNHSSLRKAILSDADLRGANLNGADLTEANLKDTDLMFTILDSAIGLTCDQLKEAKNWTTSIRGKDHACGQKSCGRDLACSQKPIEGQRKHVALNFRRLPATQQDRDDLRCSFEAFARSSQKRPTDSEKKNGQVDTRKKMESAIMSRINLRGAYLNGIVFNGAILNNAELTNTKLKDALLTEAFLEDAKLRSADLRGAHLKNAKLAGANLRHADLEGANLTGADLKNADLRGANLKDVVGLKCDQLTSAENWKQSYWVGSVDCKDKSQQAKGLYPPKPKFPKAPPNRCGF